jgi:hypothetical protein
MTRMPNTSVKPDCGTGVVSLGSRFRAAAPYIQSYGCLEAN